MPCRASISGSASSRTVERCATTSSVQTRHREVEASFPRATPRDRRSGTDRTTSAWFNRPAWNFASTPVHRATILQTKLQIGAVDDPLEREADRVADQVVRMHNPANLPAHAGMPLVKRKCACAAGGKCPECEEEETIHRKPRAGLSSPGAASETGYGMTDSDNILASLGAGRPLDPPVGEFLEPIFGYDFGAVRIHTDSYAAESARKVNALAYTLGPNIVFGEGQFRPSSAAGLRLLSHELTHVVQQGPVPASYPHVGYESDVAIPGATDGVFNGRAHLSASPKLRRQAVDCPPELHEQPDHLGSCPDIQREPGEKGRYGALGPDVRVVTPLECYVIENLPIGGTTFGVLPPLEDIADALVLDPGGRLHLTGFTDCLGSESGNANLRMNRASALEDYFIAVLGVDRQQVLVETAAETEYLDTNDTSDGRAANRAVTVFLESAHTTVSVSEEKSPTRRQPYPKVRGWINSFIPHDVIEGPPFSECFTGDDRGFSNAEDASSRTHQLIEITAGSPDPTADVRRIGTTHEVDCKTRRIIGQDTASTDALKNSASIGQRTSAQADIFFSAVASNPLVTFAPAINLEAEFHLNLATRQCQFEVEHDGFPAYEAYISADGGAGIPIYTYDPRIAGKGIRALFPPMDESALRKLSF